MKMKFPALMLGNLSSWMPASGGLSRFFARKSSSKAAARDGKEGAGCLPLAVVLWGGVVAYSASEDVRDAVDPALEEVRKVVEPAARELVHVTKTVGSNAVTAAQAAGSEAQRMASIVGGEASSLLHRLLQSEPPQKIVKKK